MNKGFKLKSIEVGKLKNRKIDINDPAWRAEVFDPAFDRFNDKYEWRKIKNNKKLKLNKEDEDSLENMDVESKETNIAIHSSNKGTWACTPVRITYYDESDNTTHRSIIEIHKLINK